MRRIISVVRAMTFGRRQQPPGGSPSPRPEPSRPQPQAVHAPPLQPHEPESFHPKLLAAAQEFNALLLAEYGDGDGQVHAPTIIGAAAALTGEFAQHAGGISLDTGKPAYVIGDAVNVILLEDAGNGRATVWGCLQRAGRDAGLSEQEIVDPIEVIRNVAAAVGGPSFPPLTVPREHYPHEYSPNACVRLRPKVIAIADRLDLSRRDLVIGLGMALYGLILLTQQVIPPAISVRLAAEIAFGVAKMSPLNQPI
jgi:hypothetical protein